MKKLIRIFAVVAAFMLAGSVYAGQPIAQKATNKGLTCLVVTADGHRDYLAKTSSLDKFGTLGLLNCFAVAFRHKPERVAPAEIAIVSPIRAEVNGIRCYRVKDEYIVQFRDDIPHQVEKPIISCLIQAEHEHGERLKDPRWL